MADPYADFLRRTGATEGGAASSDADHAAFLARTGAVPTADAPLSPSLTDPSTWRVPQDDPAQRIRAAATEAYTTAPSLGTQPGNMSILTPGAQNWLDSNIPVVGPYVLNPIARAVGTGIGGAAAVGAAAGQTVRELATAAGVPANLQRDVTMLGQSVPVVAAEANLLNTARRMPTLEDAGPKYAAGVTPEAMQTAEARGNVRNALDARGAPAAAPSSPTGIEGPRAPPQGYVAPVPAAVPMPTGAVPTTSDAAKGVATAYYNRFDRAVQDGGSMTPQVTDKFIGSVEAAAPPPGIGTAVAGKNAITDLVERLQPYKGKPMTLQDVQVVDKEIGHLITAEYTRNPDIARQLQNIQHDFRDQVSNPSPGDVVGGQAGLDALAPARKAYSQAMKMDAIERIQERADMTDQSTTSVRTQLRTLLNNPKASRGFSDEEKAALRAAAERGLTGDALHIMGSRLVPIIAGGVGSAGGFFGAVASATTAHVLSAGARNLENTLATRRMGNAMNVLGRSVPPPP